MARPKILIARPRAEKLLSFVASWFSVEEVSDTTGVIDSLVNRPPAVLLLALDLPGLTTPDRIREMRKLSPSTRIIAMSRRVDDEQELEVLRMGARGYAGPLEADMLLKMIEKVREGEVWAARKTIGTLLEEFFEIGPELPARDAIDVHKRLELLTSRERQILLLLGSGASNKEIAAALGLAVSTVKAHMSRIFRKLGQPDRVHLAIYLSALGRVQEAEKSQ